MAKKAIGLAMSALLAAWSAPAAAQDGGSADASFSASTEGFSSESSSSDSADIKDNYLDLGLFAGMLFISPDHNFENRNTELGLHEHYGFKHPIVEFGGRVGYYPVRFVGGELEGMFGFGESKDGGGATAYGFRAHVLGQLPIGRIAPFVLIGGGRMGVKSAAMGNDSDPAIHYGGGVKFRLSPVLELRGDFRNNQTQSDSDSEGSQRHHQEVLVGLSYILNFKKDEAPKDTDGDGFLDPQDKCPTVPGVAPDGCPVPDTDKDGFLDPVDKCPTEPGIAPDGCPDRDPDKDGFLDPDDKCPTVPGVAPDGCPDKDPDKDGILDPDDKCPNDPETRNGFEDVDGCPDEVPEVVQKFTGVIQGIEFDFGKATIRPRSRPRLDEAAQVLSDHSSIRIEISGHTDNVGTAERNAELSGQRAAAVKEYLVSKGIDGSRITTRGAGLSEPVADNKTAAGRQKNRRIEFKIKVE